MKKHSIIFSTIALSLTLLCIFLGVSFLLPAKTNPIDENINYENELFVEASAYSRITYGYTSTLKSISRIENTNPYEDALYLLELVWDDNFVFTIPELEIKNSDTYFDLSLLDFKTATRKQLDLFEAAKQKICKYINDSKILVNKESLIECINSINLYRCTDKQNIGFFGNGMFAVFYDGNVYINTNNESSISEFTFVHELFHGLRYITISQTDTVSTQMYQFSMFEETMTEALTYACNPHLEIPYGYDANLVGYKSSLPFIYKYLDLFGNDALYAFFYGYNEFWENHGGYNFQVEHDAMASTFNGFYDESSSEAALSIYTEIISKMEKDI